MTTFAVIVNDACGLSGDMFDILMLPPDPVVYESWPTHADVSGLACDVSIWMPVGKFTTSELMFELPFGVSFLIVRVRVVGPKPVIADDATLHFFVGPAMLVTGISATRSVVNANKSSLRMPFILVPSSDPSRPMTKRRNARRRACKDVAASNSHAVPARA